MWKEFTEAGQLKYQFLETVTYMKPFYAMRSFGGILFLIGAIVMMYNLFKTATKGKLVANEEAEAPALEKIFSQHTGEHWHRGLKEDRFSFLLQPW